MMTLRPYQEQAVAAVERELSTRHSTLICLATGCHAKGERVIMSNGESCAVEDVKVGDALLSVNDGHVVYGKSRTVLALHNGIDDMYRIVPVKGRPFVVNSKHVLALVDSRRSSCGRIVYITVEDYLKSDNNFRHLHKLVRSDVVSFENEKRADELPIDPYIVGVMLGDGSLKYAKAICIADEDAAILESVKEWCAAQGYSLRAEQDSGRSHTYYIKTGCFGCKGSDLRHRLEVLGLLGKGSGEKFIHPSYKYATIAVRIELLSGIIDTDGSWTAGGYDYVSKSEALANDVAFVARSLGLAAYVKACIKRCTNTNVAGTYYRVGISGDTSFLRLRLIRKMHGVRKQIKSVLHTGFAVEPVGRGEYYGFTVDGDNRYLLDDFTIMHNCGKTIVFSTVAANAVRRGGRVLILAHRGELLDQAMDKLRKATGIVAGLEKAECTTGDANVDEPPYTVVVGSVQTMSREKRLMQFRPDEFSLIVIDECHHAMSSTYRRVIDHFTGKVLGVTATPDRGDMQSLAEVFETIAFEYSIVQAIRDGFLVPIRVQTIPLKIDLTAVARQAGDYQASGVGTALDPYLREICAEIRRRCADRKTIVFTPLIATSLKMVGILRSMGVDAREVNGESKDRAGLIDWFAHAPKGVVMCNSMLLTEGFDEPSADCVVVLRATRVRSLYTQMVGRGTRLCEGKRDLLVLDFLWLTAQHDLCRPACLVSDSPEVVEKMTERQMQGETVVDADALDEAMSEAAVEREERLAERLAKQRNKKGGLIDPLHYALSVGTIDMSDMGRETMDEADRPTMRQIEDLEKMGIACPLSGTAAQRIIDETNDRAERGLASPKQIRLLSQKGFQDVETWTAAAARKVVARLVMTGWRVPVGIDPRTYRP